MSILLAFTSPSALEVKGLSKVIDGDTLNVEGYKVRLAGIDAPEVSQQCRYLMTNWDCGLAAKNNLIAKIHDQTVSCELKNKDRYSRYIATCYLDGENLNEWLVLNGYALAYSQYSKQYVEAEKQAQKEKKGIWSSEFQNPQDYRKAKRKKIAHPANAH